MEEIIEEYGEIILGIVFAIAVIGIVAGFIDADGKLLELIVKLGNQAC